jgi:hypothetical protein
MTVDGNSQSSFLVIQVKEQFKVTHEKLRKGLTSERTLSGFREAVAKRHYLLTYR